MNKLALELSDKLRLLGLTLSTAESCTGGWVGKELTAVPGSSDWYEGGIISYSNAVKQNTLQVSGEILEQHGAVSEPTALAMANGAQNVFSTDMAVSLTGIAGPGGGTENKPVGTVWIAWRLHQQSHAHCYVFEGNREQVREQAVREALQGLLNMLTRIEKE